LVDFVEMQKFGKLEFMIDLGGKVLLPIKNFSCVIDTTEDDIIRILLKKEIEVNRAFILKKCVNLIKRKYRRENQKGQLSKMFNY